MSDATPVRAGLFAGYDGHGGIAIYEDGRHIGYVKCGRVDDETTLIKAVNIHRDAITALTVAEGVLAQLLDEHGGEGDQWNGLEIVRETIRKAT